MRRAGHKNTRISLDQKRWLVTFTSLVVALCVVLTARDALSQVSVPSGFTAEVLATVDRPTSLAFAPTGSLFGPDLFVGSNSGPFEQGGDDRIFTISPSGTVTLFTTLLPEADPVALEFPPVGSPFGDFLYVSANNRDAGRVGDCGGAIQRVDPNGNVTDFTSLSSSLTCFTVGRPPVTALGEPVGLAFGPGGSFGTNLFVANSSDPPADIMRVDPLGREEAFVNDGKLSPRATSGLAPLDVEFGPGGAFGTNLYFTDFGEGCNCVRIADPTGDFTVPFVVLPSRATDLKFGPGGLFGNDLYVTAANSIFLVQADGTFSVFATGFGGLGVGALEFSRDGTTLLVADFGANTVYKISPTLTCVQPPDGLVSWWPLDGNTEDIHDGNSGILTAGGSQFVAGKVGLAFKSSGPGDLVLVNDAPNLDVTNFTIDAWVRVDKVTVRNMPVVWKGDSLGANISSPYFLGVIGTGGAGFNPGAIVSGTPTPGKVLVMIANGQLEQALISRAPLPSGKLVHLAVTADGSNVRLYIDGKLDAQAGQAITPFNSAFPLQVAGVNAALNFFPGLIDELEIYNSALPGSEIQAIFAAGSAGKCKVTLISDVTILDTISTADIDLDITSFSKPPSSITTDTANNRTIIEWRFDTFSIGQIENLSFDVIFKNPVPGEDRLVNHKLEVLYTDVNGNPVRTELGPQFVRVLASAFSTSVSTDKGQYTANETVVIGLSITNLSGFARIVDAVVEIEDNQGNRVQTVTTLPGESFAAGETKTFPGLLFNTGTTFAGNYRVRARLLETGAKVGEATADFTILPVTAAVSTIVSDKIAYTSNELVTLTSTVTSQSPNSPLTGLDATVNVIDPAGLLIVTETRTLADLLPGARVELKSFTNTGTRPAGFYTATLEVRSNAEPLTIAATSFEILSSLEQAEALSGTIEVDPNSIPGGESTTLTYTIQNTGNKLDLPIIQVEILVVDPDTELPVRTITADISLNGREVFADSILFDSTGLVPKPYLVVLRGTTAGVTQTLDSAGLVINIVAVCELKVDKAGEDETLASLDEQRVAKSLRFETFNTDPFLLDIWDSLFGVQPGTSMDDILILQAPDRVVTWEAGTIEMGGVMKLEVKTDEKDPGLTKVKIEKASKGEGTSVFVSGTGGVNPNLADGGWHEVEIKDMNGVTVAFDGNTITGFVKELKLELDKDGTTTSPVVKDFKVEIKGVTSAGDVEEGTVTSVVVEVPETVITALAGAEYEEEIEEEPAVLLGHTEAEFEREADGETREGVDISSLFDGFNDELKERTGACTVQP